MFFDFLSEGLFAEIISQVPHRDIFNIEIRGVGGRAASTGNARGCTIHRGFAYWLSCHLRTYFRCLSEWDHFSDFFGIVIWRILERGRSVFDGFSLSVPCLVRPGLLQNVVRAARHSRSVSGGWMLASGDQVVGALQVGAARSMQRHRWRKRRAVGVLQATSLEACMQGVQGHCARAVPHSGVA